MTFPISPSSSWIHIDPFAAADAKQQAQQALQSLQNLLAQVGPQIIDLVVNAILNAFGLSKIVGTVEELLAGLESAFSDIPQANVHNLISALGGIGGAIDQVLIDAIANALGHSGTGHTSSDILGYLESIPFGNVTSILGLADLGADVQAVIDKIVNALGLSGTGHTLSDLLAHLESIPTANITAILGTTNLGTDIQGIVDNIANALGHSGAGHTLANILSYLGSIPNANITNILGSANLGADLQAVVDKIANGLGNTGTGHTLANLLSYVGGLAPVLGGASLRADLQAVVDNISNALGHSGTGHTLANLLSFLGAGSIPNANIANVLGSSNLGADLQAVVDKIANGLGQTGTGHTLANLLTYMGGLAPILGSASLAADLQAVVDKISNALGHTGTGHTLANLLTYFGAGGIPNANITNILGSSNLGADLQAIVDKISNALGNTGTGHTLANLLTYLGAGGIPNANIANILGQSNLGADLGAIATTLFGSHTTASHILSASIANVLGGANLGADLGAVATTLFGSATTAPQVLSSAVENVLGGSDLGADVQAFLSGVGTGSTVSGGVSVTSVQQALLGLAGLLGFSTVALPPATSVSGITQTLSTFVANSAATQASYLAIDPSGDPTFNFDRLSGASLPTMTITQGSTIIGMIGTPRGGIKESVAWIGGGYTGSITDFYVNIYSVNTTTGALTFVSQSANLMTSGSPPSASSTAAWYYYDFTTPNFITAAQGNWYAVELQVIGTGTYTLAGISHQAPANLNVFPAQIGGTRTPPASTLAYGTTGTGTSSGSGSVASLTTSHTPGATDNGVVAYVAASATSSVVSAPTAVTYGGNAMTLLTSVNCNANSTFGTLYAYSYTPGAGPLPSGAHSVVATFGGGTNPKSAVLNVESFSGAGTFAAVTAAGSSTALSQASVASATGNMVSQAFMGVVSAAAVTFTGYNQTQNYTQGVSDGTACGVTMTMGHAAGASTVSFSATATGGTPNYAAIAVNITRGTSVTAPGTISGPTGSTNYPYLMLCGSAGTPQYPPVLMTLTSSGTYHIPVWATALDIVALGGGGGGGPFGGDGGLGGNWNSVTLDAAHIALTGGTVTVTVGNGGVGGTSGVSPTNGGNTFVAATGYGTLTAAGGTGAANSSLYGASPGNTTFNGNIYYGGSVVGPTFGSPPGGGGGENALGGPGFAGAPGVVFILAYQV